MRLRNWGWFSIIQKTRPLIGMVNIEEEIKLLENAAEEAIHDVEAEVEEKQKFEKENVRLQELKTALIRRLENEQGDLSQYQERHAKAATQKADLEAQFTEYQEKIEVQARERQQLLNNKRSLEDEMSQVKGEATELEEQIAKAEAEKTNKDHSIRSLNEEIGGLDEAIAKLNKEKKYFQDHNSKATEDLQTAEDKVQHLNMVKNKLEQTLDDLDDTLDREKRYKNEAEKARRKVEGDLKVSQELAGEMEREKKELESVVSRREREIAEMMGKLENEQATASKQHRVIKELNSKLTFTYQLY